MKDTNQDLPKKEIYDKIWEGPEQRTSQSSGNITLLANQYMITNQRSSPMLWMSKGFIGVLLRKYDKLIHWPCD